MSSDSQATSETLCALAQHGAHLVSFSNHEEQLFSSTFVPDPNQFVWLGAKLVAGGAGNWNYRWLDGSDFNFTNFMDFADHVLPVGIESGSKNETCLALSYLDSMWHQVP